MKKFKFIFVAIMSFVCLLGFSSCNKDDAQNNSIVGTWLYGSHEEYGLEYTYKSNNTYTYRKFNDGVNDYRSSGNYTYSNGLLIRDGGSYSVILNGDKMSVIDLYDGFTWIYTRQ